MEDTFLTVKGQAEAQLTEKRSRFLAFVRHIADEEEVKKEVAAFRKEYHDARHVCYAYVLNPGASFHRAADDGEPSGTAGRPILGQILSRKLTNTLVIVVRYFGGVKLGTGPLSVAYKTAASLALDAASIEERMVTENLHFSLPYTAVDAAMRLIRASEAVVSDRRYTSEGAVLTICVRLNERDVLHERLSRIPSLNFLDE